jgi:hypothetical protein
MTVYRYMPAGYEGSNLTGDQAAVRVGRGEIVLCNQCSTLSVRVYHDAAATGSPARAGESVFTVTAGTADATFSWSGPAVDTAAALAKAAQAWKDKQWALRSG